MRKLQQFWSNLKSREFSKSEKLRLIFVAIIFGIWLGQWSFLPNYVLLGGVLLLFVSISRKIFWLGIFAGFLLANSYAQWRNFADFQKDSLPNYVGQEVQITGKIVSFPDIRENNTRFYVEAESLDIPNNSPLRKGVRGISQNPAKISGKFLLIVKNSFKNSPLIKGAGGISRTGRDLSLHNKEVDKKTPPLNPPLSGGKLGKTTNLDYGNKISIQGKLIFPTSFTADFDYRKYLKRFGVQTIIKNPAKFSVLAQNQGNWFLQKAKIARNWLEKNLERSLPNPHAKIAMGVLLGVKNELPKWTKTDFQNSGLMHLLVVSGTNVAIVIMALGFLLRKFGRRISFAGSLLALLFFVLMTGADAPILRAALMGGIAGLAIAWGKMSDARNLVLLSAVIIGLFQPQVVQNDLGFALSFGATLGILVFFPIFEKKIRGILKNKDDSPLIKGARGIFVILGVSLSAQIAILPILNKSFGYFPLGGIPANLFSEPLMPFIMFFSFISTLAGAFPLFLAKIIAIPAYILIEILLQIAHFFAGIPVLELPDFLNNIFVLIILSGLFYGLFLRDFVERFLVVVED